MSIIRTVESIMQNYNCDADTAQLFCDLRDEGHGAYQAAVMVGLADPAELHDDLDPRPDLKLPPQASVLSEFRDTDFNTGRVSSAAWELQYTCHNLARKSGWWTHPDGSAVTDNPLCFSNKLMLVVSELAEAMEGDRKGIKDDKLPHRDMREVELADAVIRIFDLAGAYNMDLAGAIAEKLAYNQQRADHKPENRAKAGGKAY